ncbi:MAG: ankyrin repeat domain-containing protein [Verrucomicrobia bacterium]|nr:ankyrin repeat domain-containing protein [Verrucomicrobiota bacterium]
MKHLLLTTIAAVVLVGCGESQQSTTPAEAKPVEPIAEAAKPEPQTAKAPDISIWEAAMNGNIEAVKKAIADGADVNVKDKLGGASLHYAANNGRKEIVELLIAEGADVNARDNYKWTPLHDAALRGHKEIAELLIANGADVNAKDALRSGHIDGWAPLHAAAGNGNKETAELLIAKGADVNAKMEDGDTPLDLAEDEPETADLLRKHGGKTAEELKAEGK